VQRQVQPHVGRREVETQQATQEDSIMIAIWLVFFLVMAAAAVGMCIGYWLRGVEVRRELLESGSWDGWTFRRHGGNRRTD
jgi:hypothetical protein